MAGILTVSAASVRRRYPVKYRPHPLAIESEDSRRQALVTIIVPQNPGSAKPELAQSRDRGQVSPLPPPPDSQPR